MLIFGDFKATEIHFWAMHKSLIKKGNYGIDQGDDLVVPGYLLGNIYRGLSGALAE